MTSDSGPERKFWQIALADLERQLGAGRNGISSAEAAGRRLRYGPNTLEERRRLSLPLKQPAGNPGISEKMSQMHSMSSHVSVVGSRPPPPRIAVPVVPYDELRVPRGRILLVTWLKKLAVGWSAACIDGAVELTGRERGGWRGGRYWQSPIHYTLVTSHSASRTFVNHVNRVSACSGRGKTRSMPADKSLTVGA
jgi:Cation transporter/ATPase, N-terminus